MNTSDEVIFRAFLADTSDSRLHAGQEVHFVRFEENYSHRKSIYGLNSRMLFGRIVYSADGFHRSSNSLAIKQTPAVAFDRQDCQLQFVNELHFFTQVLPLFDLSLHPRVIDSFFPKFLYSFSRHSATAEHTAMIFENLRDSGFEDHRRTSSILLDYIHLGLVMRRLGQFHGYSLAAAASHRTRFHQLANFLPRIHELHLINYWTLCQANLDYALQLLVSAHPDYAVRLEPLRKRTRNFVECLRHANHSPQLEVVSHGDLMFTNLLFRYESDQPVDVKALDMGLWRLASPALDLANVLYVCADQQTRDQHWNDLLVDYLRGIADIVGAAETPSMETIVQELRTHGWFVIMIATHCIRDQQARADNSTRFFDVFGGVNLWAEGISTEQIRQKLEQNQLGGAVAIEMIVGVVKDLVDRNLV